jgi:hypothetical protein
MIHGRFENQIVLQINSSRTCFATEQPRTDSQLHGDGGDMSCWPSFRPHAGSARSVTLPSVRVGHQRQEAAALPLLAANSTYN